MSPELLSFILMFLLILVPMSIAAVYARLTVPDDGDYSGRAPRFASCLVGAPMKLIMLMIVPGAFVLFMALSRTLTTLETRDWPTAEGTVYSTSMEEHPGLVKTYTLHIEYRFQVDQVPYTGFKVTWYDFRTVNRADITSQLTKYPKGKAVTVHYDPDGAYNSVLETRFGRGMPFIWGITAPLMLLSILATTAYLRAIRLVQKHARSAPNNDWQKFY